MYSKDQKKRRDEGLCIKCGAPALEDLTINPAARLAFSQGRVHRQDKPSALLPAAYDHGHKVGWTFKRLSTQELCSECQYERYEKPRICRCKKHLKVAGRKCCVFCLERDRERKQAGGKPETLPSSGMERSRKAAALAIQARVQGHDKAVLPWIEHLRASGYGYQIIADRLNLVAVAPPRGGFWHKAQVARICRRHKL